ncbi:MAG: ABC transporter permease [Fibrobacteres bacterium]|nr:ABC transporter permease [Fibrobacterota bacterium]
MINKFKNSPWCNSKLIAGGGLLLLIALLGIIGPLFYNINSARVGSCPLNLPPAFVSNPGPDFPASSISHPLGTESSGRDIMALLIAGLPNTLRVGLFAASMGIIAGIILGFMAGYLGGWVDNVIRTLADSFMTIPRLAVLIVISAYVKQLTIANMAFLLAMFAWMHPARVLRGQVLSMRERGYVRIAKLSNASSFSIMFKEIMPNLLPFLAASFTGGVSATILAATGLEALGLGPSRIPTLGMTIFYSIRASAIIRGMWWWWGFPILLLVLIFISLFLITLGMDEVANPKLRKSRLA